MAKMISRTQSLVKTSKGKLHVMKFRFEFKDKEDFQDTREYLETEYGIKYYRASRKKGQAGYFSAPFDIKVADEVACIYHYQPVPNPTHEEAKKATDKLWDRYGRDHMVGLSTSELYNLVNANL